jgi:hypothetical protein
MHSSIKNLLEEVGKKSSKHKHSKENTTGLILGFDSHSITQEHFITHLIRKMKKYANEIIVSLPSNYDIQDIHLTNELKDDSVKISNRDESHSGRSVVAFEDMVKRSLNEKILFVPYDLEITSTKLENLVNHRHSLLTYLGSKGNFCPALGFLNRWSNRFNLQILKFNQKEGLDDLYRVCSEMVFLKLTQQDQIRKKTLTSEEKLINIDAKEQTSYFPQRIHYPLDEQSLVKMIALIHILAKEIEEKKRITSSFKVQQFLTLSNRFAKSGHFFLAYQVPLFIISNEEYEIKFPLDWSYSKICDYGRRLLLEESNFYAGKGYERLRYACLKDLKDLNLYKESESEWVRNELSKIMNVLKKDNINHHTFI